MTHNETEVIFTCACAGDLGARVGGYTAALLFEQPDGRFTVHDVYEGGPHYTFTSFSLALDKMVAIAQHTYAVMQRRLETDRVMNVVIENVIEEFETLPSETSEEIDQRINKTLADAGIDTNVEPDIYDYDNEDMYWEAHAKWANEQSGETARRKAEVAAILGVEYYGKK